MALDMTQSGENAAKANEHAGLGGDFAGGQARALQDGANFQQAVKFAQAAPTTMIPGVPPLVVPEQYIPGTEKNQQLSRETVRALEHAYGNFRENSRHIGQLIENGQYGEAARQLITGIEPGAPANDMQSGPALNDWSGAFGDKEKGGLQRSAPEMPDTQLEGFPGERLPPPPPLITPAQEPQPQITWTPIPEQTKPEAIGGGFSAPEVDRTLPGFTPVDMPPDSHISKSEISDKIEAALKSSDPNVRLEGEVAKALQDAGIQVTGFQKPIGLHGSKTEIDVETNGVIIEVTNGPKGKLGQVKDRITEKDINPDGKAVILYAPNYQFTAGNRVIAEGASLEKNLPDLIRKVKTFEGN